MKRFALLTATALTLSAPAFAYTGVSPTMVSAAENILIENGFTDVAVGSLSDEQIVEIYAAGQAADSGNEKLKIEAVLADEGVSRVITERRVVLTEADASGLMPAGESSVVVSVQNFLDARGFEADASTLTDAQIAELYFLAYGSDMSPEQDEIETILNM